MANRNTQGFGLIPAGTLGQTPATSGQGKYKIDAGYGTTIYQGGQVQQPAMDDPINPDPRAEAWAAKNTWFGTDRAMTYTAFEIHKDLTEKEGYDPNSDEYYAEVDKRIRVDFPHKFGNTDTKQSTAPVQTVASANRSVKPGRKTVRLTSSQVAIAKKLGVPLEEYAKQLKNTEGA